MGSVWSIATTQAAGDEGAAVMVFKDDVARQQTAVVRRMAERQVAMQVASVRELMYWFVPFSVASYAFLYKGYRKTNSWVVMFPLIPVTFGLGYQLHYAYGSKTRAIRELAEQIMMNEHHMMAVPEWSTPAAMAPTRPKLMATPYTSRLDLTTRPDTPEASQPDLTIRAEHPDTPEASQSDLTTTPKHPDTSEPSQSDLTTTPDHPDTPEASLLNHNRRPEHPDTLEASRPDLTT